MANPAARRMAGSSGSVFSIRGAPVSHRLTRGTGVQPVGALAASIHQRAKLENHAVQLARARKACRWRKRGARRGALRGLIDLRDRLGKPARAASTAALRTRMLV